MLPPVDAHAVGLNEVNKIVDNGSDSPGTILGDCGQRFSRRFAEADLVVAESDGGSAH